VKTARYNDWERDYYTRFSVSELEAKRKFHAVRNPFFVGLRNALGPALVLWGIIIVLVWKVTR
jgi:hypothetical protein